MLSNANTNATRMDDLSNWICTARNWAIKSGIIQEITDSKWVVREASKNVTDMVYKMMANTENHIGQILRTEITDALPVVEVGSKISEMDDWLIYALQIKPTIFSRSSNSEGWKHAWKN